PVPGDAAMARSSAEQIEERAARRGAEHEPVAPVESTIDQARNRARLLAALERAHALLVGERRPLRVGRLAAVLVEGLAVQGRLGRELVALHIALHQERDALRKLLLTAEDRLRRRHAAGVVAARIDRAAGRVAVDEIVVRVEYAAGARRDRRGVDAGAVGSRGHVHKLRDRGVLAALLVEARRRALGRG